MKIGLFFLWFIIASVAQGQRGDELLVYSVKGNVTAVYNNQESVVKIGKVLTSGYAIKTGKNASVTMICQQGRPLSVEKEGIFPVSIWRDSCITDHLSLTTKYFRYVWEQLYHHSPEYKKYVANYSNLGVSRGEDETVSYLYPPGMVVVEFPPGLDTLNYVSGSFPLSWYCYNYNEEYQFCLYTSKTRELIFTDSIDGNQIRTDKFEKSLKPGISYAWTITANAKTGVIRRRILNCVPEKILNKLIDSLKNDLAIAEYPAAQYFRIAYILEKKHFLIEANKYYQKAAEADPDMALYREKMEDFRFDYRLN